jgi:hypothetical protein
MGTALRAFAHPTQWLHFMVLPPLSHRRMGKAGRAHQSVVPTPVMGTALRAFAPQLFFRFPPFFYMIRGFPLAVWWRCNG